jgi:hypothetical protein
MILVAAWNVALVPFCVNLWLEKLVLLTKQLGENSFGKTALRKQWRHP